MRDASRWLDFGRLRPSKLGPVYTRPVFRYTTRASRGGNTRLSFQFHLSLLCLSFFFLRSLVRYSNVRFVNQSYPVAFRNVSLYCVRGSKQGASSRISEIEEHFWRIMCRVNTCTRDRCAEYCCRSVQWVRASSWLVNRQKWFVQSRYERVSCDPEVGVADIRNAYGLSRMVRDHRCIGVPVEAVSSGW